MRTDDKAVGMTLATFVGAMLLALSIFYPAFGLAMIVMMGAFGLFYLVYRAWLFYFEWKKRMR